MEEHLNGNDHAPAKEIDIKIAEKSIKKPNLDYGMWVALDQQVLRNLLTTMTREIMAQVATATISAKLWSVVEEIYSSQKRVRSMNTCIALAMLKKGNMPAAKYMSKMKALAD